VGVALNLRCSFATRSFDFYYPVFNRIGSVNSAAAKSSRNLYPVSRRSHTLSLIETAPAYIRPSNAHPPLPAAVVCRERFAQGRCVSDSSDRRSQRRSCTSPVLKPSGTVAQIRMDLSPRLARIISRVDVVDACWPGVLHLQDRFLVSGPTKMRVLLRHHVQGARLGHLACLVELFAHAEADAAA